MPFTVNVFSEDFLTNINFAKFKKQKLYLHAKMVWIIGKASVVVIA